MKIRYLVLTFALAIISTFAFADNSSNVIPKSTEITSFGVKLGQPLKDLKVLGYDEVGGKYLIKPKEPIEFFDSYKVTATPDAHVYRVAAYNHNTNPKYTCNEIAAYLSQEFEKTYDTTFFKPIGVKVGEYIYMSDDVSVSIMCTGESLSYMYSFRKELSSYPVPVYKFKDVKIKL